MDKSDKMPSEVVNPEVSKVDTGDFSRGSVIVQDDDQYHAKHGFSGDEVQVALRDYVPDSALEKRMLRKVDLYQLPMLWMMCVMAYVDRNNIVGLSSIKAKMEFANSSAGQCERRWHE